VSKRGRKTFIYRNFEFWLYRENRKGQTLWRCSKRETFKCRATLKTFEGTVVETSNPDHTHTGNVANALARKAINDMKVRMTDTIATPSASQGAIITQLPGQVQMALPKRSSLSRVLRRHRQINSMIANGNAPLPPIPQNLTFNIPPRYQQLLLSDTGTGNERVLIFGERDLLLAMSRAEIWLADGTFKVCPQLFFQLYSIHFQIVEGFNPAGVYCLLPSKSRTVYDQMIRALKELVPDAAPRVILTDFEAAAMNAFKEAFPEATLSGCYFHLCQSVIRKVADVGLKPDYETDDEVRGFIRCLPALSHVPIDQVVEAFDLLMDHMPANEKVHDVTTYFEHTYVRGRRRPGRGENYGPAIFPIPTWNKFDAAGDGVARTTNSVEGWHNSLQSLFMCQHPTMWTFLTGLERDSQMNKASYLQTATGQQNVGKKVYRDLKARVMRAIEAYGATDNLTYLRAIAHLSHS